MLLIRLSFHDCDSVHFSDVLLVSNMAKNLISVSSLCHVNNVHVVFSDFEFQVKDGHTGGLLLRGPRINGLYISSQHVCMLLPYHMLSFLSSNLICLACPFRPPLH